MSHDRECMYCGRSPCRCEIHVPRGRMIEGPVMHTATRAGDQNIALIAPEGGVRIEFADDPRTRTSQHDPDSGCDGCPFLRHSEDFGAHCKRTGTHLYASATISAPGDCPIRERLSPAEFARHVFGPRTPIEPEHLRPLGDLVRAGAGVAVRGSIRGRSVVLIALDLGPQARAWGPPAHPED